MYNLPLLNNFNQKELFDIDTLILPKKIKFPSTRYQGSKNKLLNWIDKCTENLEFDSVLDAFGGTGCVGHMFKQNGKKVYYNDILKFNYYIGLALIENNTVFLEDKDLDFILTKHSNVNYKTFIQDTFKDIYFTDDENEWLDIVTLNIKNIKNRYKQALAYYCLFQSCLIKRPYNLFHRKNLYMRQADIKRNFGNKKTWDTDFKHFFLKFAKEVNCAVFDNGQKNMANNMDIFDLSVDVDLVYIDTPYISSKGTSVNYLDFYHFLEGLVNYNKWNELIDFNSKNKKFKNNVNVWNNKDVKILFDKLFCKYADKNIVVSYRNDGFPTIKEIIEILQKYKNNIEVHTTDYKYVLSTKRSKEILIIAK